MSIGIKEIRVNTLSFTRKDDGRYEFDGSYGLIASNDIQLAKQTFGMGDYRDMKYQPSPNTQDLAIQFMASIRTDINQTLGLN